MPRRSVTATLVLTASGLVSLPLAWSQATDRVDAAAACTAVAAPWRDGRRGIAFDALDAAMAIPLCEAATRASPEDGDLWAFLARALNKAERYAESLVAIERSVVLGSAAGLFYRGVAYSFGDGVEQDEAEAVEWFRLAAEQGYALAQNNLGGNYPDGSGVEQDDAEAVKWFRLAAVQGNAHAQYNLGWMYDKGRGVEKDDAEAVRWYRLAVAQGNADVLRRASLLLVDLGDVQAVEPLITRLGDEDEAVRSAAVVALGQLGDPRTVQPLIARLSDEDAVVRAAAAEALDGLDDARAVEPLITRLGDAHQDVRKLAAEALGALDDARAVETLAARLGDNDAVVRAAAAAALGKLGGETAWAALS